VFKPTCMRVRVRAYVHAYVRTCTRICVRIGNTYFLWSETNYKNILAVWMNVKMCRHASHGWVCRRTNAVGLAAWTPESVLMRAAVASRICKHARRIQLRTLNAIVVDETCTAVTRTRPEVLVRRKIRPWWLIFTAIDFWPLMR